MCSSDLEYNRTAEENGWVLGAYAEEDSIQLTKDEPAKRYKQNQQDVLDQWVICMNDSERYVFVDPDTCRSEPRFGWPVRYRRTCRGIAFG